MQTKQKIYEVAKMLFIEEGYHKVTNRRIAEVANVNQGLITYYFKHKKNIATTIYKEHYQIMANYLRAEISVEQDAFLFNITINSLFATIIGNNPHYASFMNELLNDNLLIESVYSGVQKSDIIKMIEYYMSPTLKNLDKEFKLYVATTFSAAHEIQRHRHHGVDIPYDEFNDRMVRLHAFALHLPFDDEKIQYYITRSNEIIDKVFQEHPHLLHVDQYLYNKDVMKTSIVEDLLDLK